MVAERLRAGRRVTIQVGGSSMVPAIWPGDRIEVAPAGGTVPERGRIALFMHDGRLCAHRIVAVAERQVVTRGDGLAECDAPVDRSELLGYVAGVIRGGRALAVADASPSRRARMLAFAIRNSTLLRRLILGLHARQGLGRPADGQAA